MSVHSPRNSAASYGMMAVIDVGSNSIRLVVYKGPRRAPLPVLDEKVQCGLGRGMDSHRMMSPQSVDLAIRTISRFADIAHSMRVSEIKAVATAAVRTAANGEEFRQAVENECGISLQVLTGEQEARLSASGMLCSIPDADGIVGDLGGGSLELVEVCGGKIRNLVTLPLGTIPLSESGFSPQKVRRKLASPLLDEISWLKNSRGKTFYAVGGSWRSLAKNHMETEDYPLRIVHAYSLSRVETVEMLSDVSEISPDSVRALEIFGRSRAEHAPYAAALMESVIRKTGVDQIVFCTYGLREGCIYDGLSEEQRQLDPLVVMCEEVALRAGRTSESGETLYRWISTVLPDISSTNPRLMLAICHLSDIGISEHPEYRAEQVFLRISRMPIVGISHPERVKIALSVASRHAAVATLVRRWEETDLLDKDAIEQSRVIGLALRLAYTVCGGVMRILENTRVECLLEKMILYMPDQLPHPETVGRRLGSLAKALGCDYETVSRRQENITPFVSKQGEV